MDFFKTAAQRSSVREYSDALITQKDLEKIVDAGRRAPSARAVEPCDFIVITNKAALSEIAHKAENGRFIADAGAGIVIVAKETKYYLEDGCAATQNILLAATALGIGSCWIAGDKKPYSAEIMQQCGVPAGYTLVSIISLGYPKEPCLPHTKRPLSEVLHREKF